jgi:hypothetical protein
MATETVATDCRNIDTTIAETTGEGAQQRSVERDQRLEKLPIPVPLAEPGDTYYGVPVIKPSVWSVDVPLYYFLGGAAGAALTLGAAMQVFSKHDERTEIRALSAKCHWIGIVGSTLGAVFLVHDLGRPERFLHMMRVFRPTSPMNVGVWILGGAAPTAIATGLLINRRGLPGRIGEWTGYVAGVFGVALAGYTGVLVGNTVLPIWQQSRCWIPVLFIASAASAAAGVLDLLCEQGAARRITMIFGTAGRVAEIAAARRVETSSSVIEPVGRPFREGAPGMLWKTATALTAASLAVSFLPIKSPRKRRVAGLLSALGSLCLRFAVHYLGTASARDPRATFEQQRAVARSLHS